MRQRSRTTPRKLLRGPLGGTQNPADLTPFFLGNVWYVQDILISFGGSQI